MKAKKAKTNGWAVKWESNNQLDGHRAWLCGCAQHMLRPSHLAGYTTMVFKSRREAREYISRRYGYIADRPDLKQEPHGWKMPRPVRVTVSVTE